MLRVVAVCRRRLLAPAWCRGAMKTEPRRDLDWEARVSASPSSAPSERVWGGKMRASVKKPSKTSERRGGGLVFSKIQRKPAAESSSFSSAQVKNSPFPILETRARLHAAKEEAFYVIGARGNEISTNPGKAATATRARGPRCRHRQDEGTLGNEREGTKLEFRFRGRAAAL